MCQCGLMVWFYFPQTSLRIFGKIEVGSFGPTKGCREDCLVAWRVVHAPQGKAQLTFGILPGDDGCYLSQGLSGLNPAVLLTCVLWDVLPGMSDGVAMQSPFSKVFPTQAGVGAGMVQPQGRGDQMSFREPIQPENPGLPCATGRMLKAYFSAP